MREATPGSTASGLTCPAHLQHGGILEMLAVAGRPQFDTRTNQSPEWLDVEWRTIDDSGPGRSPAARPSVFAQGFAKGGARFGRLEGAWYGNGRIYFVSTSGGNVGQGQIFEFDPAERADAPAVRVSVRGCAQRTRQPRASARAAESCSARTATAPSIVHGLTIDGTIFRFAQNNVDLRTTPVNGFNQDYRGSRVRRRVLQPRRQVAVLQRPVPGHHALR